MYLSILVFVCGAAVMALEIISSRFFAPYIGTSVLVWTSLIGIVMAGLSCGYMLGGVYGDRWKSLTKLRLAVGGA
ncbi:spermine synthase, partial [Candidatus Peregrinibacteria bacterium CG_4_9_14_3_um_filter_49_12]